MRNKTLINSIKIKLTIGLLLLTFLPYYVIASVETIHVARIDSIKIAASSKQISTLGKVWGLLKYHHPSITERALDWDQELLTLLPSYILTNSSTEHAKIILKLVNDLGQLPESALWADSILQDVKMKPDFSWINKSGFSTELVSSLDNIINYRSFEKQKYIAMTKMDNIFLPTFTNEKAYSDLGYPKLEYRLLAVFRYWNMVEYWYPYKDLMSEKWEKSLSEFIADAIKAKDEPEYILLVQKMVATIKDSHASVISIKAEELKGLMELPFTVKFIEDKAVINSINTKLTNNVHIKIGAILTRVEGVEVRKILDQKRPYVGASNEVIVKREVAKLLTRTRDSLISIELTDLTGQARAIQLKTAKFNPNSGKKYDFPYQRDSTFFVTKENILYINVGTFRAKDVTAVKPLISKIKGIVIDARQYPRTGAGNAIAVLTQSLMDKKKQIGLFSTVIPGFPGYFKYVDAFSIGNDNPSYFKGLVTVLVNEETQSTGEFLTMAYQLAPTVRVIGSTTSGADGNVTQMFAIPGGFYTEFTGIGVYYPDKGQTQQIGIVPDIKVHQTIQGFRNQKDELLEKAIHLIDTYKIR
jgi:C-terminal processing protease CtpA/Prc